MLATGSRVTPFRTKEKQSPNCLPETILSLSKTNKAGIRFVQGRFNMGGSASLRFAGERIQQLVLSKRNPKLRDGRDKSEVLWGFTIVRYEEPNDSMPYPRFTYLAPLKQADNRNGVLRFESKTLPVFPDRGKAYAAEAEWGTIIKLYEYQHTGWGNSNILQPDGLLERLDLRLPGIHFP